MTQKQELNPLSELWITNSQYNAFLEFAKKARTSSINNNFNNPKPHFIGGYLIINNDAVIFAEYFHYSQIFAAQIISHSGVVKQNYFNFQINNRFEKDNNSFFDFIIKNNFQESNKKFKQGPTGCEFDHDFRLFRTKTK